MSVRRDGAQGAHHLSLFKGLDPRKFNENLITPCPLDQGSTIRPRKGRIGGRRSGSTKTFEHDPEKCVAVFPRDKREAFARRSCSIKDLKRDNDST